MEPIYRLFIDEVGHGSMKSTDHPNERFLSLTGIIMGIRHDREEFKEALDALKVSIFGRTDIILHRNEIVRQIGPFACLRDHALHAKFDAAALELVENSSYRVITVVIDKLEHKQQYLVWQAYPYHYCLMALLERYVIWLDGADSYGDVMTESRGKKDNKQLSESYQRLYDRGTDYVAKKEFQKRLTTRELKISEKSANVSGLQLADLLANPSMRSMICERYGTKMTAQFGWQIVEILKNDKYRRKHNGQIGGVGRKWLP
jgi:hypothetical protein